MTATIAAAASAAPLAAPGGGLQNKFLLVALAFQRSRQLQSGARPRVETDGHKFLWVAMREATTGLVSWEVTPPPAPASAAISR
jgi:DNA-directed RNA polymerase omega subunit